MKPEKAESLTEDGEPWQAEFAAAVTSPAELLSRLELDPATLPLARAGLEFPIRVPRPYLARMRPGDPDDPLLRQVWAHAAEDEESPGFVSDPVGDGAARREQGILGKYPGRALVLTTGACAIHCRYCFRRHFPYAEAQLRPRAWRQTLTALAADPSLEEIILSGGDPLSLDDPRLAGLLGDLQGLASLRRLRLHTRLPVVLPQRVTPGLVATLAGCRLPVVVVIHANHAQELDAGVAEALSELRRSGATLLNQAVLLRGVNDTVPALAALSGRLFECGVLPYYLHQLDRVAGAAHFEVPEDRALRLEAGLRGRLPGYLVPRLVRETPGASSKLPLFQR